MKKSKYNKEEVFDKVIQRMREGLSCFKACEAEGVPNSTFMRWVDEDKNMAERYARARHDLIERIAADTMLIADQPPPLTPDGKVDNGAVQAMRLQVDTRKWLLSKLAPKRYGERVALAADEESPLQVGINVNFVKPNV